MRKAHLVSSMVGLMFVFAAPLALAQGHIARAPSSGPPNPGYLTHFNFHLNAASLKTTDQRFDWDTDFGGDIDLVDYGYGRINFLANFEAILGEERKEFDANQGNYTLDLSASYRRGPNEFSAIFHHVSRHLSDRVKQFNIDWNAFEASARNIQSSGKLRVESQLRLSTIVQRAFVDYSWELGGGVVAEYPLDDRFTAIWKSEFSYIGTDPLISGRENVRGGRIEGGVRLLGKGAAAELFMAYERRVDADPVERVAQNWFLAGFRLINR